MKSLLIFHKLFFFCLALDKELIRYEGKREKEDMKEKSNYFYNSIENIEKSYYP